MVAHGVKKTKNLISMTESFFKKKEFIRLLLAKEKGLSWVIEYKPPAACLGRKDNTSVFLGKKMFCKHFYIK